MWAKASAAIQGKSDMTEPSEMQGVTTGIKAYAATHAVKEEMLQQSRVLAEALQTSDPKAAAKMKREMSSAARSKVLLAAQHHLQTRQRLRYTEAASSQNDAGPNQATSVTMDELMQQRRSLLSAGFEEEAEKVQAKMTDLRHSGEREKLDLEQRLFKQRASQLEFAHKIARERLGREQAEALATQESTWREEIANLTAAQARAKQEFELRSMFDVETFERLPSLPPARIKRCKLTNNFPSLISRSHTRSGP